MALPLCRGGFPGGSVVKNTLASTGDVGLIPGLGRAPRQGNGSAFQYSCLGNAMDRRSLVGYSPRGCQELGMT